MTDKTLTALALNPAITDLNVSHNDNFTDEGALELVKNEKITHLDISYCPKLTDAAAEASCHV